VWRATWKSLLAKKLRLVLTALSIVLGVGFVAGTFVLTDTMNAAFDELFTQTATTSDLVVRNENAFENSMAGGGGAPEREPLDAALLETVQGVPGVEVAVGDVSGLGSVVDPATGEVIGGMGPPTLVISWNELAEGVLNVREGAPPTAPGQVAIDAATAERYDLSVGQDLSVIATSGADEFEIVGIMSFGETDNLAGATLTIFQTSTAQRILDKEGQYDAITIKAAEDVDTTQLRRDVQAVMPDGVETITSQDVADESADQLQQALGFFGTALLVFAAIALFVGSFIIVNTFSIIVAQRTRELALLRTLGATRRQVLASVIGEAAVVGLVASVIGVGAGILIAVGIQGLLKGFGIELPSTGIQLQLRTIVVSLVVGLVVTLVASIIPARHAAKVAPIQALREPDTTTAHGLTRSAVIGGIVWLAGSGALAYGLFGQPPNAVWYVGAGAALTLVGVAMLSPLAARPVAGTIGAPFRRLSVSASIGRGNAMRNPRRTASTAAALMIGLGLVSMVAIFAASLKTSIDATLTATLRSDLTLSGTSFLPISPEVAETVSGLPEVEAAAGFRQNAFRVDDSSSFLTGFDPATVEAVATLGEVEGSVANLAGDTIAVHRELATDRGWQLGDEVPASFPAGGEHPLTIVAIYEESSLLGDFGISLATFEEVYVDRQDTFVLVKGAEGVAPDDLKSAVESSLEAFPNVQVQDQAEFRESFSGQIDVLLSVVTALLLFAIVIAVFGIINTLGLSVYERTRELGLLRAVGMSRTQVKRMVRYESVIIALFGALLGLLVGIGFGWALQQALAPEGITELEIPVSQLAIYVVFAALAGVLAAIWPARKAAKLNVLESIAYE
jgi:putative ABC transport system permease protein